MGDTKIAIVELVVAIFALVMLIGIWAYGSGVFYSYSSPLGEAIQLLWGMGLGMLLVGILIGAGIADACHKLKK